ncbi:MAG: ABC transporter permease [Thermoanaerobaculia bacterium]
MRARRHPIVELTLARVREFLREPEATFWVFAFPILLAGALGLAFRSQAPEALPVAVEAGSAAEARRAALAGDPGLAPSIVSTAEARSKLRTGRFALVVRATDPPTYFLDPTRPESRAARLAVDAALERAAGRADRFTPAVEELTETGSRYIDFLVPGLLGMNLMGTGMWSIGFSLVQARSGKLLKRYIAAPMRRWHYLAAQILSRLVFLALEVGTLLAFARFALGVPVLGSLALLSAVTLVGAMTFVGLGLLVAARPRTIEGVSGLMNLVMVPMWIGSGIFFSTERFPAVVQPFVQALPLTALNNALRAVMLDGSGVAALALPLAILAAWSAVGFLGALKLFRWQ